MKKYTITRTVTRSEEYTYEVVAKDEFEAVEMIEQGKGDEIDFVEWPLIDEPEYDVISEEPIPSEEPIYTVTMDIGGYEDVPLNIVYSAGEFENELEFESCTVDPNSSFTQAEQDDINKLLEGGAGEYVIEYLKDYYSETVIDFITN
jgi:hypothetical protein